MWSERLLKPDMNREQIVPLHDPSFDVALIDVVLRIVKFGFIEEAENKIGLYRTP